MGHLQGLRDYLNAGYAHSMFDQMFATQQPWEMRLHGQRIVQARVVDNRTYEVTLDITGHGLEEVTKLQVKCLYAIDAAAAVGKLLKMEKNVQALGLEPIYAPAERYIVKNKTLFPLMKEREVVFCTLLEGEVIRGIIADFSRYDLTIHAKGGLPIVILRHSIYDLRTKQGRCLLKSFQDQHKDWQKSAWFVS
jgi:hypothetical protein